MPATTDAQTTLRFADRLTEMAEEAGYELAADDAAECGWMVERGQALEVELHDENTGTTERFLVHVQRIAE